MRTRPVKIWITACFLLLAGNACDRQLDINDDPSRLRPDEVAVENLLPAAIRFTAQAFWDVGQYGNFYPHYLAGNAGQQANIDSYNPYGFDNIWQSAYRDAMPTLTDIIGKAEESGAVHYAGIAKLLMALNLMQCTDVWGDLPYREAFQGVDNLAPAYDPQEQIYREDLKSLLDGAVEDLGQPAPELPSLQVQDTDLIYKGEITSWLKAAHAARARYYLHLSVKDPAYYEQVLEEVALGFDDQGGGEDLELGYTQEVQHPWYGALSNVAGDRYARPSSYFVNLMNGNGPYQGLDDPRLPLLVDNGGAASYTGRPVGARDTEAGAPQANVDITANTFYGSTTSSVPVITYYEQKFIEAEALFHLNDAAAYEAYLDGIRASMNKFGVGQAAREQYLEDPLVSKGAGNLELSDIMLQKYMALFLQMETWSDMRRHQYDPDVYTGLEQPFRNLLGDRWVQRGNYPDNEPGRNPNVPDVADQAEKIWLFDN